MARTPRVRSSATFVRLPAPETLHGSGMTAFETETVESCHSLGVDAADLFRPVSLVEIRRECARSSHSGRRASAKFSAWSGALAGATLACPSVRGPALDAIVRLMTRLP